MGHMTYALLTRAPLISKVASYFLLPFDLHVLGTPPAFTLSQDQTLHNSLNIRRELPPANSIKNDKEMT